MSGKGSRTDLLKIISWKDFVSLEDTSTAATPGLFPSQGSWNAAHTAPLFPGDGSSPTTDLARPRKLTFGTP